jgi:hypothetical protein
LPGRGKQSQDDINPALFDGKPHKLAGVQFDTKLIRLATFELEKQRLVGFQLNNVASPLYSAGGD